MNFFKNQYLEIIKLILEEDLERAQNTSLQFIDLTGKKEGKNDSSSPKYDKICHKTNFANVSYPHCSFNIYLDFS